MGYEPEEGDLPPLLTWELPLWNLYCQLKHQVRIGVTGVSAAGASQFVPVTVGLDLNVFIPIIERKGWHLPITLDLLTTIEDVAFHNEFTD